MKTKLKLAVVQFSPEHSMPEKNMAQLSALIENHSADVFVLPELCLTGYFFSSFDQAAQLAETKDGPSLSFFQQVAQEKNALVVGGFIEKSADKLYNSVALTIPEQSEPVIYQKTHLFYQEPSTFSQGNTGFFSFYDSVRDVSIGMMICYDWRFPEVTRLLALQGADLIVCPSNLITNIWQKVLPARAIENKVYIAVANRCGQEVATHETLTFTGHSAIYKYNGDELAKAQHNEDCVIVTDIYPKETRNKSIGDYNDIFRDRLPQFYS